MNVLKSVVIATAIAVGACSSAAAADQQQVFANPAAATRTVHFQGLGMF